MRTLSKMDRQMSVGLKGHRGKTRVGQQWGAEPELLIGTWNV